MNVNPNPSYLDLKKRANDELSHPNASPRGDVQYIAYKLLINDPRVVFLYGDSRTGKLHTAIAAGLVRLHRYVDAKNVNVSKKIVITYPDVAKRNLRDDSQQCKNHIVNTLNSQLSSDVRLYLEKQSIIEIKSLTELKGEKLRDAYIILIQGQNVTATDMYRFIMAYAPNGRQNKIAILGDPRMRDLPDGYKSGLDYGISWLAPSVIGREDSPDIKAIKMWPIAPDGWQSADYQGERKLGDFACVTVAELGCRIQFDRKNQDEDDTMKFINSAPDTNY